MSSIFGLNSSFSESKLILIPAPWDLTSSLSAGSALSIEKIKEMSSQIDLYDLYFKDLYKKGIHLMDFPKEIEKTNKKLRKYYLKIQKKTDPLIQYIESLEFLFFDPNPQKNKDHYISCLKKLYTLYPNPKKDLKDYLLDLDQLLSKKITDYCFFTEFSDLKKELNIINEACLKFKNHIYESSLKILNANKKPSLIGGDHSCPIGLIEALNDHYKGDFSLLHIDAHFDLRKNYQSLKYSHASIMHHVISLKPKLQSIVSLPIREFSQKEYVTAENLENYHVFYDQKIHQDLYEGNKWEDICEKIISKLSDKIYISFDVDGLFFAESLNTPTPVPGGISYSKMIYLFQKILKSKKKIIGFDLSESGFSKNHPLNEVMCTRLLYQLCLSTLY